MIFDDLTDFQKKSCFVEKCSFYEKVKNLVF